MQEQQLRLKNGEYAMIRKLQKKDIHKVAAIWLAANLQAHNFISSQYWQNNFAAVQTMLAQAEVYVYVDEAGIQGFIGLAGDHIAGIFVESKAQSAGIGKQLLDFVKGIKKHLSLSVYQKNMRAAKFYKKENFTIKDEQTDENTGEKEYLMIWQQ